MINQLGRKCPGDHAHQHLVGNRAKDAAFYPVPLVRAILKGISLQTAETAQSRKMMKGELESAIAAVSMSKSQEPEDFGEGSIFINAQDQRCVSAHRQRAMRLQRPMCGQLHERSASPTPHPPSYRRLVK